MAVNLPSRPYLPTFPPKSLRSRSSLNCQSQCQIESAVEDNLLLANKVKFSTWSCRTRTQVGNTNRWRLPEFLGTDLLGTSQAMKAIQRSYSATIRNVRTADNPLSLPLKSKSVCNENRSENSTEDNIQDWFSKCEPGIVHKRSLTHPSRQLLPRRSNISTSKSTPCRRSKSSFENPTIRRHSSLCTSDRYRPEKTSSMASDLNVAPSPMEKFIRQFQIASMTKAPDILLYALNMKWYLHSDRAFKSVLLRDMFNAQIIKGKEDIRTMEREAINESLSTSDIGISVSIPRFSSSCLMKEKVTTLKVSIEDSLISKQAFATGLLSLYTDDTCITIPSIMEVAAVATFLGIPDLQDRCSDKMERGIKSSNVCAYYDFSMKYGFSQLQTSCETWLSLNLITGMSEEVRLQEMSYDLLDKILKTRRLFTCDEYAIYKFVCTWVFFKLHPHLEVFPCWETIVTWFMSLPKAKSFLTTLEGKEYATLFDSLRLNGITESDKLEEMQKMNVVPMAKILRVLSDHYYALQGGGDMPLMARFELGALRYGYVLDQQNRACSKVIPIHGFYFELVGLWNEDGSAQCFFQRLKPSDSLLPFRVCERQTFSMRQDREVRYSILVQWIENKEYRSKMIGPMSQCFGFGLKSGDSKRLTLSTLDGPLYVTYYMLLPPS